MPAYVSPSKIEAIRNADLNLNEAGLPTYSDLVRLLNEVAPSAWSPLESSAVSHAVRVAYENEFLDVREKG